jgi:FdhD protein
MFEQVTIPMNQPYKVFKLKQYKNDQWKTLESGVILEQEVSLTVNGDIWLNFTCTPVDLEALAVGFLFNERQVNSIDEIVSVRVCPDFKNVDLWLTKSIERPKTWRRTSGCGGGFTREIEDLKAPTTAPEDGVVLNTSVVSKLIEQLLGSQDLYKRVGGVHTSVLSDGQNIIVMADDIGRHNTLDKIAGHCLLDHIQLEHGILITTGRISSEMLQKASRIGSSVLISRSSPSSLAVEYAKQKGIILIGYAHGNQFIAYTFPDRIT